MTVLARRMQRISKRSAHVIFWLLIFRIYQTLRGRQKSASLPRSLTAKADRRPFMAFSGSGLLLAYYHGVVTYIRDHFHVDDLRLSGISGGCSTVLALAMGIDLYQILLLGLHMKKKFLREGVYLNSFEKVLEDLDEKFQALGITDVDCEQLASRQQCFIGVTSCLPPRHQCTPVPSTRKDLAALWLCSMSVLPFFRTPGRFKGRCCVDGGFSAVWSVPSGQPWHEVIKVTCMPRWVTVPPPAMDVADIQPSHFMLAEVFLLVPWHRQCTLIRRGYEDAKAQHNHLVLRGLRPLPDAPLTPWSEWEQLFADIDEDNLPPLSASRSTMAASEVERRHAELLRTYSASDLHDALQGPRLRRLSSGLGSRSEASIQDYGRKRSGGAGDGSQVSK